MLGFGIDTAVASAEEVQNAMLNQEKTEERKASPKQVEIIEKTYGDSIKKLLDACGVEKTEDLPMKKASDIITAIMKKGAKE